MRARGLLAVDEVDEMTHSDCVTVAATAKQTSKCKNLQNWFSFGIISVSCEA
jgi:hypothetical protein